MTKLIEEYNEKYAEWRRFFTQNELSNEVLSKMVDEAIKNKSWKFLRSLAEEKVNKICNQKSTLKPKGDVEIIIDYKDGTKEIKNLHNTILQKGKIALASVLVNDVNDPFDFYIDSMIFGTNGAVASTPKYVDESRTALFGTTLLTKGVVSSIDTAAPTIAILTSVITFDEGNGSAINEMALKMKNRELYSMITFGDLNKTSSMQLIINWEISIL